MGFYGTKMFTKLLVAVFLAFACMSVPVYAKTTTPKQAAKENVQKDSKKDAKKKSTSTKESEKKKSEKKNADKKDSKKADKSPNKKDAKKESKKDSKKNTKKESKKDAKKKNPPKRVRTGKAELVTDTTVFDEPVVEDSSRITISADDPKAFTKALLYEKEGVEFEIIKKKEPEKKSKAEEDSAFFNSIENFDFSSMLIPVTHEALLGSPYGVRSHRLHRGVDVNVIMKEPIVAAYPGKVIMSKYNKGGYGHYVLVEHENGLQTLYGHLAARSVKVGDYVYPGDIVGLAGNTGRSSGAHLHFEIRYGEINIDPATIINFPKWELQPGVDNLPKKKVIDAHRKMQAKLKKENFYVVKKGDTLTDVALWFNISEDAVIRINNLTKGQSLTVGQTLKGCK
ncbi:murein DD-endopeptidase MepM/ murein hydrolase activator NlpD [Fibrobacter sp. UWR4]|nr:murein DD-endopeptidase MepM/ murein hydrolase activator NlpD [Fibrobacter sp. UWR4]PZW62732.1 murein DD-endopeptidase MepM/ murein hydrolase activator NlpD [Fibrobacter sp. UWR1]